MRILEVGGLAAESYPFVLDRTRTLVGSGPFNDLSVPVPDMPRVACEIVCRDEGDGCVVRPVVPGGILLNGKPLENECRLRSDDVLQAGRVLLVLRIREEREPDRAVVSDGDRTEVQRRRRPAGSARRSFVLVHGYKRRDVPAEGLSVGSAPHNDLVVRMPGVSRLHFRLVPADGRLLLRDCGSTNGIFVNGICLKEGEVAPGSTIQAGSAFFTVPARGGAATAGMVGSGPAMERLRSLLMKVAPGDLPVLLLGETGTGKELAAREVHALSRRAERPFIPVNCGAISPELMESELFGHRKGAFTGAQNDRKGMFVEADGGTLFLDEIGELPIDFQAKLLRVLENEEIRAVGADRPARIDVRVVAATNRDLRREIRAGRFREDLFYRLFVVPVALPPLRERKEDILDLIRHFAAPAVPDLAFTADAARSLIAYPWSGNIRQLKNFVARTLILHPEIAGQGVLGLEQVVYDEFHAAPAGDGEQVLLSLISDALLYYRGNLAEVARALSIGEAELAERISRYGLSGAAPGGQRPETV